MDQILETLLRIESILLDQVTHSKQVLTLKAAAKYLDLSESAIYRLTSERKISFFKPEGKKIYFKREDLEEWMMRNQIKCRQVDSLSAFRKIKKGSF